MRAGSERNEKMVVLLVEESDGNNHPVCVRCNPGVMEDFI